MVIDSNMYHIKYLLFETNPTEGCVSLTLGYSLLIAFKPSPINIFIHPVPQSTKRVSSIQKNNKYRCKYYDMIIFVFVFFITLNCLVF